MASGDCPRPLLSEAHGTGVVAGADGPATLTASSRLSCSAESRSAIKGALTESQGECASPKRHAGELEAEVSRLRRELGSTTVELKNVKGRPSRGPAPPMYVLTPTAS